jgi:class 3 adenylate cyclase
MRAALQTHHQLLHETIAGQGGFVFNIVGDGFLAAFPTAIQALEAAVDAQRRLATVDWGALGPLRVRMGIHTGEAELDESSGYLASHTLNRAARIMSAGYGGQILLSAEAAGLCGPVLPPDMALLDLGLHQLKGLARPERIYQANAAGLPADFRASSRRSSAGMRRSPRSTGSWMIRPAASWCCSARAESGKLAWQSRSPKDNLPGSARALALSHWRG